ncbi:hypothetical protein VTI28DRAFT_9448 [Corynascus sepedonium]
MTAQIEIVSGLSVPCCQQNIVACRAGGMIGPFAIGHEASKPHHIAACLRGEASERRCAVKEAALTLHLLTASSPSHWLRGAVGAGHKRLPGRCDRSVAVDANRRARDSAKEDWKRPMNSDPVAGIDHMSDELALPKMGTEGSIRSVVFLLKKGKSPVQETSGDHCQFISISEPHLRHLRWQPGGGRYQPAAGIALVNWGTGSRVGKATGCPGGRCSAPASIIPPNTVKIFLSGDPTSSASCCPQNYQGIGNWDGLRVERGRLGMKSLTKCGKTEESATTRCYYSRNLPQKKK